MRLLTKIHFLFFLLFLVIFPFNIRKVFLSDYSYFTGHLSGDTAYFLNISDIFLTLMIVSAFFYLIKNKSIDDLFEFVKKRRYFFLALGLLVIWSGVSVFYAESSGLAFFGTVKLLEFSLLFLYITYFLRDYSKLAMSWLVIATSGLVQACVAIAQYVRQESIGLNIVGESIIGQDLVGVAKIIVDGEKIVRPYGTFGHPNILGGFLVFSLIVSLALYLLSKENNRKLVINLLTFLFAAFLSVMFFDHYLLTNHQGQTVFWLVAGMLLAVTRITNWHEYVNKSIIPKKYFWVVFIVQFVALVLTYSRTAWFGLVLVFLGMTFTIFFNKGIRKILLKTWVKISFTLGTLLFVLALYLPLGIRVSDTLNTNSQSIEDRISGAQTSFKIIKKHPLTGVGNKNYVISISNFEDEKLEYWQYQPVHNGYLLLWSELGLVGLTFFGVFASLVAAPYFIFSGKSKK